MTNVENTMNIERVSRMAEVHWDTITGLKVFVGLWLLLWLVMNPASATVDRSAALPSAAPPSTDLPSANPPSANPPSAEYPPEAPLSEQPDQSKTRRTSNLMIRIGELVRDTAARTDIDNIRHLLGERWALQPYDLANMPYIAKGGGNRQLFAPSHHIYVRGQLDEAPGIYSIVQRKNTYLDPITDELLGLEVFGVGQAQWISTADGWTVLKVIKAEQPLQIGNHLMPANWQALENNIFTESRLPQEQVEGRIVTILKNTSNNQGKGGEGDVAVINKGFREGLNKGDVLAIHKKPAKGSDQDPGAPLQQQLTADPAGFMMVLRVFEKMSYTIVLQATTAVVADDFFRNPESSGT